MNVELVFRTTVFFSSRIGKASHVAIRINLESCVSRDTVDRTPTYVLFMVQIYRCTKAHASHPIGIKNPLNKYSQVMVDICCHCG